MSTDAAASALPVQPTRVVYRKSRTGTFVGGVIGFLAGLTAAGSSGFLYLVDGQQQQAQALVASVDNVERHVAKVVCVRLYR